MPDLALQLDQDADALDIALASGDLAGNDGLATAVAVSLWSDGRAQADDALPDNTGDRRGWWADGYTDAGAIGSRLWLLSRSKLTPGVERLAERYAREALQWMIGDGLVQRVDVTAERADNEQLHLHVALTVDPAGRRPDVTQRIVLGRLDVSLVIYLAGEAQALPPFGEYEYEG